MARCAICVVAGWYNGTMCLMSGCTDTWSKDVVGVWWRRGMVAWCVVCRGGQRHGDKLWQMCGKAKTWWHNVPGVWWHKCFVAKCVVAQWYVNNECQVRGCKVVRW